MNRKDRFLWSVRPCAFKENIVSGEKYRFTILTSKLIRMEYSKNGCFEDRASQHVFYRDFPICKYTLSVDNGILRLETEHLLLTYKENMRFERDTLSIKLKTEPASTWCFGDDFETLGGTVKTLDQCNGAVLLEDGVCSRNGFSVIDDSNSILLGTDGWVEIREKESKDFYFFGYGFSYLDAVKDLYRLTGAPPLLPAYALGNWWSRCHKYTQKEYVDLIEKFKEEDVPLTVAVIDFDWHIREIPKEIVDSDDDPDHYSGWCGYSWNKDLFPDYKAFLSYLQKSGLKTSLNLHPVSGVAAHEDMYNEMAEACNIDPTTKKRVPFDVLSKEFMEKYFDILHHPYEKDGVGFWWIDWQQGTDYWWVHEPNRGEHKKDPREVVDPLWMLNHLHTIDSMREGNRPLILSRYSGIGSHRYPVGFSGDVYITWKSLAFQPYFTACASNVGYSWYSHDIGGFMRGYFNSELFTRWVQLGVFSPINRLHGSSVGGQFIHKTPWTHKEPYKSILTKYLRLRHELFPYIYTMNYRNHVELEPLIQPMYYAYPKCSAAYEYKNQYMFGSELMVCPITEPLNEFDSLASTEAWLPKGSWFDFFKGLRYESKKGRRVILSRSIEEYPVFAKAGSIVPLYKHTQGNNSLVPSDKMEIVVFPGATNSFTLYEDEGDGNGYKDGVFAKTKFNLYWSETPKFEIEPAEGTTTVLPKEREWSVLLRGFHQNIQVKINVNGEETLVKTSYDRDTLTHKIIVSSLVNDKISFCIMGEKLLTENDNLYDHCYKILDNTALSVIQKQYFYDLVRDKEMNHKEKLLKNGGVSSLGEQHLYDALLEMTTLTREDSGLLEAGGIE